MLPVKTRPNRWDQVGLTICHQAPLVPSGPPEDNK